MRGGGGEPRGPFAGLRDEDSCCEKGLELWGVRLEPIRDDDSAQQLEEALVSCWDASVDRFDAR